MKKLIVSLASILIVLIVYAQDNAGKHMYERIYLTPKTDKITMLNKNLAAHNKKYHGEGNHTAGVQFVITGRRSGDYVWAMGPGPFANLDTRPAEGGHDDDWNDNVMPYLEKVSQNEYWTRDDENYYDGPENYTGDKLRIRFHRIKLGTNDKFSELMAKIVKVYKEKKYNRTFGVYWNTFPTAKGRNVATGSGFPNWAIYDDDNTFPADFNSIHGEDSFQAWLTELREIIEWTDNEVVVDLPELGGVQEE